MNWVPSYIPPTAGLAARDAIDRIKRQPPPPDGTPPDWWMGIISFFGILLVIYGTYSQALEHNLGGLLACVLAVLIGIATYWGAYRTHGWLAALSGVGFALLSAYVVDLEVGSSEEGTWIGNGAVFLLVGFDQFILKFKTDSEGRRLR